MKLSIDVITANFNPFRLVFKDEKDKWSPSLKEINTCTYDYVKLHRFSAAFDVGIAPLSLGMCFDGTLFLPSVPQFRDKAAAFSKFNETLTVLLLGGVYCEAVTPDDIGYGNLFDTGYVRMRGGGTGPSRSFHEAARSRHISLLDVIKLNEPENITARVLFEALEAGREFVKKLGEIPQEQVLYGTTFTSETCGLNL